MPKKTNASTHSLMKNSVLSDSLANALNALDAPFSNWHAHDSVAPLYGVVSTSISEKSKEVDRQIERIKPYLNWIAEDSNAEIDCDSLNAGIALLRIFATTPSPVPMLSMGSDGKPTFYMTEGDRSLEATVDRDRLEYLFTKDDQDTFFEDTLDEGQLPANLLYLLYCHFAKNTQSTEVG